MLYDKLMTYFIKNELKGTDRLYGFFQQFGFKKLITVSCKFGLLLELNPYEYIEKVTIKEGFYESEITEEIINNLNNGDTFWDIGANIGLHSLAVKKNYLKLMS